ncbi:MAG: hypothetical protein JSW62_04930 [Thermoplasmatales archaeon]|nr:MAG: hypothetical protein JSW62_04930 [Thermoplasmatales archaeon]
MIERFQDEEKLGEMIDNINFTKGGREKTSSSSGTSLIDVGITKKA